MVFVPPSGADTSQLDFYVRVRVCVDDGPAVETPRARPHGPRGSTRSTRPTRR